MNSIVILFSGGLDSYLAHRWAQLKELPHDLLRVNMGQPYNEKEEQAIIDLGITDVKNIILPVCSKDFNNIPDNLNIEIPGRNMFLSTIAMMMGYKEIWMVSLKGEMSYRAKDKNQTFLHLMSGVGSFVFQDSQGDISVLSPFAHLSKLELVKKAITWGVTKDEMLKTSSCLSPVKVRDSWTNCGNCKVCIRRAGIFRQCGFDEEYAEEPFTSIVGKEEIKKCRQGYYDKCRADEILGALGEI